jgi:myo-inositol-1(or 4)-monophosphatase
MSKPPHTALPFDPRPETLSARAAARVAGAITVHRTDADVILSKGGLDIVTGTDLAAEDAIREVLTRAFPDYAIVGEERGGEPPATGAPYWLIDPLCGTQSYAAQIPTFCTNIALVERGVVTLAAVFDGATQQLYVAERGRGAYLDQGHGWQPVAVKDGPVFGFEMAGHPYDGPPRALGALFAALLARRRWYLRLLGTTLPFVRVASGQFAGLFLIGPISSPLHTAAGCLLCTEAGAVVTDTAGQPWDLQTHSFIVAATEAMHAELLELYREAFASC